MTSQSKPESDPENTAPEDTAPEDTAPEKTASGESVLGRFGTSQFQRWASAFVTALFLLVSVVEYVREPAKAWSGVAVDAPVAGLLVLACVDNFQRTILVGEKEIREVRPLWRDQSLQISEIQRVHVPTTQGGLWLYTDPDGSPALKIGAGLEAPDEFGELVIQSVPPEARITGLGQEGRVAGHSGNESR